MLTAQQLTCIRNDRLLFSALDFSLIPGEVLHLQGENGAGKSSLLQILVGLLQPESGYVCWQGESIVCHPDYKQQLFYLGHKAGIKTGLTVGENLQLCAMLMGNKKPKNFKELLAPFQLQALLNTSGAVLSAGQKQRVALSRLLLTDAKLWVLDEPFNAIDQSNVAVLVSLIKRHIEKGGMLILTSHQSLDEFGISERQLLLSS
jgi:heme exporter protein A